MAGLHTVVEALKTTNIFLHSTVYYQAILVSGIKNPIDTCYCILQLCLTEIDAIVYRPIIHNNGQ